MHMAQVAENCNYSSARPKMVAARQSTRSAADKADLERHWRGGLLAVKECRGLARQITEVPDCLLRCPLRIGRGY